MMNFKRYEFSKQVQPELEKFLIIVEKDKTKNQVDDLVVKILPKLPLSHYNLETTKVEAQDDIITIDSDTDDLLENKNESPNISMSILSLTTDDTETIEKDINVIKNTLKECLNDNRLLESEDIQGLFQDLSKQKLTDLFNFLYEDVSDFGLLNLGETLDKSLFYIEIVRQYCKLILLKKLIKTESSVIFMPLVSTFVKNYSSVFREEVLLPFLNENLEHVHVFEQIYKNLPQSEKELFIREFLFSCQELEEGHILILQPIVPQLVDFAIKRKLINLMSNSADKFKENKIFMKILIEIVKSLTKEFLDLEPVLYSIIEKNKTIFKISAEKALNTWFNNCNAD